MAGFAADLDRGLDDHQRAELIATYLDEWMAGVRPIPGVPRLVEALGDQFGLGVVSNTHNSDRVPSILDDLGIAALLVDPGDRHRDVPAFPTSTSSPRSST